jgi:Zn-dependent M28 family amino/carboxypeptidase
MVATLSFVLGVSCAAEARQSDIVISALEEIAADFESVPCRNRDRLDATKELLVHYGARSEMISVESHRNASNLVVTREGSSSDTILIGAHYDVAELGCGAVDNWSGVVALAHLYRTIRSLNVSKRVLFVAFGGEERGLLGSAGMANTIPDEELTNYCAMINLDSFGLAWPYATMEISSPTLVQLAEEVADDMEIPFRGVRLPGTGSDSSSFLERGIPAITLSGLSNDWRRVLHTVRDQPDKVNSAGVFLGYRLALSLWHRIERAQCNAFR